MVTIDPLGDVLEMIDLFSDVALGDPLSAVLVLFGALFVTASVAAFGYLALGALVDAVMPETLGQRPQQRG